MDILVLFPSLMDLVRYDCNTSLRPILCLFGARRIRDRLTLLKKKISLIIKQY